MTDDGARAPKIETDEAGDAAIEWLVRLRAGPLAPAERARLEAWRAESAENAAAFEDVLRMYGHLAGMSPARRARPARRGARRKRAAALALAAAALAAAALASSFDELAARLRADHYAEVGERKLVTLDDGSRVTLDSKSAILVRYGPAERRVALLSGEAFFEAAADASRPFVVEAAGGTATALGTAFDVALEPSGARVTVAEHRVALASGGATAIVEEGRQGGFARGDSPRPPEAADVNAATAWRRGKLIMTKRPLREVLAAIGRHHRGVVYCLAPSVCERRVSGVFGAEDALQSLREIETSLKLRAVNLGDYIVLLY